MIFNKKNKLAVRLEKVKASPSGIYLASNQIECLFAFDEQEYSGKKRYKNSPPGNFRIYHPKSFSF